MALDLTPTEEVLIIKLLTEYRDDLNQQFMDAPTDDLQMELFNTEVLLRRLS